jgi:branched-chain amino acid transport system permease protein
MLGINVAKTRFLTFGISSSFAATVGILIAPMYFVSSTMGAVVGVKAFSAAVVGGFGNITGAFYGGIILGIVESVGGGFISSAYKDALSFLVMILVLYFKPSGLFARRNEQKY